MGRHKRRISFLDGLEITAVGAEGHAIGRNDSQVVFVKYAAPGDVVDVKVTKKKKNFQEGQIIRFQKKSSDRIDPFCPHFTYCGGCKWQHLPYEHQLAHKQQQVVDALNRIGGISDFEIHPILGSEETTAYRNKLELTFSEKAWLVDFDKERDKGMLKPSALGFHVPGQFSQVLDIEKCYLMPDYVNDIQRGVKAYCIEHQISFHNIQKHEGMMRNIMFRCNSKNEWMVVVAFYQNDQSIIEPLMNYVKDTFSHVHSLGYIVNEKMNDSMQGCEVVHFAGEPYLTEELGSLKYKIQPLSFFQTNTKQAKNLYDITKDFAELSGDELVYDLYTGTGSIALYVADKARFVVGVEYVEAAIEDAKVNAEWNKVNHTAFYAGDMKEVFTQELFDKHGLPDVIITDPPREGMHPDVIQRILESGAKKIVYVSCNPATQARDAQLLSEGYQLTKIQPVDMFPHTHHVENVALFTKK